MLLIPPFPFLFSNSLYIRSRSRFIAVRSWWMGTGGSVLLYCPIAEAGTFSSSKTALILPAPLLYGRIKQPASRAPWLNIVADHRELRFFERLPFILSHL
jgi:hypothetical protein